MPATTSEALKRAGQLLTPTVPLEVTVRYIGIHVTVVHGRSYVFSSDWRQQKERPNRNIALACSLAQPSALHHSLYLQHSQATQCPNRCIITPALFLKEQLCAAALLFPQSLPSNRQSPKWEVVCYLIRKLCQCQQFWTHHRQTKSRNQQARWSTSMPFTFVNTLGFLVTAPLCRSALQSLCLGMLKHRRRFPLMSTRALEATLVVQGMSFKCLQVLG